MPDITISTTPEVKPVVQDSEIKKILTDADDYKKLKEDNDRLEAEILREEQLRARRLLGGRGNAGQITVEKTKEEIADEEAKKILSMFR